jgi:hypothetical protein
VQGNILAFVVPAKNGTAFLYGVPVVPLSRMSSFLSKATAVYFLPDCPEPARRAAVELCGPKNIPLRTLQVSVETLGEEDLQDATVAI